MKNKMTYLPLLLWGALVVSCSGSDDIGNVNADYMKVTDIVMNGNLSSTTLHIDADCPWKITESVDWLTVNPTQGTGSADVQLITGANPSSVDERTCQITITTDGGVQRTITLSQGKNDEDMKVSTQQLSFDESGGKLAFTVTSNTRWNITGGADWVSLSADAGQDNGEINVTAQSNTSEDPRTATFTITGNSGTTAYITVTQAGKNVLLLLGTENIDATAKSGTYTLRIQSNTDWTASTTVAGWVEILNSEGSNDGNVTMRLSDNVVGEARTANIRVTSVSGRTERICVITQAAATPPVLTQPAVSDVGRYEASLHSNFTSSLDISECGFCYSTQPNPTIIDRNVKVTGPEGMSGELSATLSGLTSGVIYYVRSWARNANGVGYSSDAIFKTEGSIPGEEENPTPNL